MLGEASLAPRKLGMIDSRPHFHVLCKPKSFSKITIDSSEGDYTLWITSGYFFILPINLPSQMCLS